MTRRPRITEESVLTRWMGMEAARINDSVVAERKTLASLLAEEKPAALTKGGARHPFDRDVLSALAAGLPEEIRKSVKIPLLFFVDVDVRDSCYLTDETAVRALKIHGDLGEGRRLTDGRLWIARAIAYAIARKYPTAVQFVLA
ncbi:MAG TPA: DUF61 family protein [Methanomicrobiales archaeon]|nr:DUF61 family protein [Methanomicrobiales archaeon]